MQDFYKLLIYSSFLLAGIISNSFPLFAAFGFFAGGFFIAGIASRTVIIYAFIRRPVFFQSWRIFCIFIHVSSILFFGVGVVVMVVSAPSIGGRSGRVRRGQRSGAKRCEAVRSGAKRCEAVRWPGRDGQGGRAVKAVKAVKAVAAAGQESTPTARPRLLYR